MIIFGIEIRRRVKQVSAMERMKAAIDEINDSWRILRAEGDKVRPWVIWDESKVVLSRWEGKPSIIYESRKP